MQTWQRDLKAARRRHLAILDRSASFDVDRNLLSA